MRFSLFNFIFFSFLFRNSLFDNKPVLSLHRKLFNLLYASKCVRLQLVLVCVIHILKLWAALICCGMK